MCSILVAELDKKGLIMRLLCISELKTYSFKYQKEAFNELRLSLRPIGEDLEMLI